MKKLPVILLLLFLALIVFIKFVYYGSLTRNCIYTEKSFPIPAGLEGKKLLLTKDVYVATGKDKSYACLDEFNRVNRVIIDPASTNNITIGNKYYTERGLQVESVKKGKEFEVVGVVSTAKHGILTIDSGGGQEHFLILKDSKGILYKIFWVSLGINKGDEFIALKDSFDTLGKTYEMLSSDSFTRGNNPAEDNLIYTGKFTRE